MFRINLQLSSFNNYGSVEQLKEIIKLSLPGGLSVKMVIPEGST